jgi:hypothetical protein
MRIFTRKWFAEKVNKAIKQAGPRYSPKVNVSLPINRVFYGLGRTNEFYLEFSTLRAEFAKEWEGSSIIKSYNKLRLSAQLIHKLSEELEKLISFLERIPKLNFEIIDFNTPPKICKNIIKILVSIDISLRDKQERLQTAKENQKVDSGYITDKDLLNHFIYEIRKIREVVL